MTDPPPSRYRVMERGRRLEVIDTRASPVAGPRGPDRVTQRPFVPTVPRKTRFDGTREWMTHPAYDAAGPRIVRLDPPAARWASGIAAGLILAVVAAVALVGLPVLIGLAVVAGMAGQHGKPWLTRRLDRLAVDPG